MDAPVTRKAKKDEKKNNIRSNEDSHSGMSAAGDGRLNVRMDGWMDGQGAYV